MKNNISIFLSSNDNYAPFVATTIASIMYNTKSFIDFYILDSGISNFRKKQIADLKYKFKNFNLEFIQIDLEQFKKMQSQDSVTFDTYSRFLIPTLKPEIKKAIYLDVDLIVLDDIKKLYDEPLDSCVIGAVTDPLILTRKSIKEKIGLSKDDKYFNAGVLLIDCEKWRKGEYAKKLFKMAIDLKDKITYADQCLLNIAFKNNCKNLPLKYNFTRNTRKIFGDKPYTDIVIKHFIGPEKPWLYYMEEGKNYSNGFEEFWFFMKMTNFYEGAHMKFVHKNGQSMMNNNDKLYFNVLGIPLLKIKNGHGKSKISLFKLFTLFTATRKSP